MLEDTPWTRNLAALARCAPGLRRRITAAAGPCRLREVDGRVVWWRGLTPVEVEVDVEDVEQAIEAVRDAGTVVVAGVGGGAILAGLLEHTDATVHGWDRDPAFLRAALQRHDLSRVLESGRLVLHAGADLLGLEVDAVVVHPHLGVAYAPELALWREGPAQRALVVDGGLLVDDVIDALAEEGWGAFRWEVRDLVPAELDRIARGVEPQVVVGINHTQGLAEACAELGVPLVEWEIDPATDALQPTPVRGATVCTWKRAHVALYQKYGFEACYLPLAANPERRRPLELTPEERASYGVPLAYVGSSMVSRGRELLELFVAGFARVHGTGGESAARELASNLLALQRKAGREHVLPTLLERVAPGLERAFAAAGMRHRPSALLDEAAAATYRLQTLAAVSHLGLHIWGDPGWKALEPHGAVYRGWAGHFHELTRIYSGGAIHVDVGRLYQLDIVPMRIFDVLAAGGFVLAEHSEALVDLLEPGIEVETWQTREELVDKAGWYRDHPGHAAAIAARGRARVIAEHTVRRRVRVMLERAGLQALSGAA